MRLFCTPATFIIPFPSLHRSPPLSNPINQKFSSPSFSRPFLPSYELFSNFERKWKEEMNERNEETEDSKNLVASLLEEFLKKLVKGTKYS